MRRLMGVIKDIVHYFRMQTGQVPRLDPEEGPSDF
jgi:hypothetical protein